MAVSKKERLILLDFDDEKDDINVSEKAISEGIAYQYWPLIVYSSSLDF